MRTINLTSGTSLYAELPDIVRAFGGDIAHIYDTSEQAQRVEIAAEGITLTAYFYNGAARFSLLPVLRQHWNTAQYLPVIGKSETMSALLTFTVSVYNAAGNKLNTVESVNFSALFVAAPLGDVYGGTRYITYNPNFPSTQNFVFLANHENYVRFASTALPLLATSIKGKNGLTTANISQFFGATIGNIIISTNGAQTLNGDNIANTQSLRICVEIDSRAENVVFLRWLDNVGLEHYHTFAFGARTTTAATGKKYTPSHIINNSIDNAGYFEPVADKTETITVTFGDDAINEKYLDEIVTLCAAPTVEIYAPSLGNWVRVVVNDTSITEKRREHTFKFSAVAALPQNDTIQW